MNKKQAIEFGRLCDRLAALGLNHDEIRQLIRAERALHRWAELECGDGNDHGSWSIERDETTGHPYMVHHHYMHGRGKDYTFRHVIADREAGALRRIARICTARGLHFFHQTDPRGCALYVSREPLTDSDYTRGVAVVS